LGRDQQLTIPDLTAYAVKFPFTLHSRTQKKAKGFPWKSQCYIAELSLPDDNTFRLEQTEPGSKHYTLWCDEELIRASVVRIIPMRGFPK
jgi:hypothetical protein